MAAWPMAWAKWLLPVPPGPRNNASSRLPMKAHVARSNTRLRFILGLKLKSTAPIHLSPADVLVRSSRQSGRISATRGRSQTRGERSGDRSHKSYVHVLDRRHAGE